MSRALTAPLAHRALTDEGGASSSSSSSSTPVGWDATQWYRIPSALRSQLSDYNWTDLETVADGYAAGAQAPTLLRSRRSGIWTASTTTDGAGYLYWGTRALTSTGGCSVDNPKTQPWAAVARVKFKVAPGTLAIPVSLSDDVATDARFGIDATSTTVLQLYQSLNGSTIDRTAANAYGTIGVAAGNIVIGTWVDIGMWFDPTAGTLVGHVGGNVAATSTLLTNQPTPASFMRSFWNAKNALEIDAFFLATARES